MAYLAILFVLLLVFAAFRLTRILDRREQRGKGSGVDKRKNGKH